MRKARGGACTVAPRTGDRREPAVRSHVIDRARPLFDGLSQVNIGACGRSDNKSLITQTHKGKLNEL
jgi:hypothetical protein